jgi:hypothetical protein
MGYLRMLEHATEGRELTEIELAAASCSSRRRRPNLGRIGNSRMPVNDRGWERVL